MHLFKILYRPDCDNQKQILQITKQSVNQGWYSQRKIKIRSRSDQL